MSEKEISLILRIEGGTANEGLLDIYDAAKTIFGLARSLNLVTHSFANDEEVRKRNQSADGANAFIHSSKKGCFEEQVDIHFDAKVVDKIGKSVIANVFWDYTAWAWSYAIGNQYDPTTPQVKKIAKANEFFIYDIANALETPMAELHKSIVRDKNVTIFLHRPRIGDIVTLNSESLDYVTTREEQIETEYIVGNVTRFNVLSDFGRLFSDEENQVMSFQLKDDDPRIRGLAVKSMQEHTKGESGKLHFKVSKIVNARGYVKRYIVYDILEM